MGPPGIGKTQIMEQISQECKIGLVAYTITHHTRQSAIGLPFISHKKYGEEEYAVTEYTMSEIVASVYDEMERTGLQEGILFIDEINCVSETLAPAMLQFLQCKTFGSHRIPQGWVIVAAGNPPQYNKSVREFDIVTLDRVKKIEVSADFSVWKEYAYETAVHPAVISYLNIRKQYFYQMETTVDGRLFATPRGWEDLSRMLSVYEKLGKEMDREVVLQYIQLPKAAKDFANYLELYRKYQTDYQIEAVLEGLLDPLLVKKVGHAAFDERLSVIGLFLSRLFQDFREYLRKERAVGQVHRVLEKLRDQKGGLEELREDLQRINIQFEEKKRAKILTEEEKVGFRDTIGILERCEAAMEEADETGAEILFDKARDCFQLEKKELDSLYTQAFGHLEHVLDFMESVFGESQEMVIFITELNGNYDSVQFLQRYSCQRYYHWNEQLLFKERHNEILQKMDALSL